MDAGTRVCQLVSAIERWNNKDFCSIILLHLESYLIDDGLNVVAL